MSLVVFWASIRSHLLDRAFLADRHPGYYKVMSHNERPYEKSYALDES